MWRMMDAPFPSSVITGNTRVARKPFRRGDLQETRFRRTVTGEETVLGREDGS